MKDYLLSLFHHITATLPGTAHQWVGCTIVILLSYVLPRIKNVKANSLIEAVINGLLATPGIGALLKAIPVLNAVLAWLGTQSVTTTTATATLTTTTQTKPPSEAPPTAAMLLPFLIGSMFCLSLSCATVKPIGTAVMTCALDNLPANVLSLVDKVLPVLEQGNDPTSELQALGIQYGEGVLSCALQKAISVLFGDSSKPELRAEAPLKLRAIERAQNYLRTGKATAKGAP